MRNNLDDIRWAIENAGLRGIITVVLRKNKAGKVTGVEAKVVHNGKTYGHRVTGGGWSDAALADIATCFGDWAERVQA